ncbi:unnamed protein product [Dicrocoelium dendriticum]|nr:unnamed protein product [Dicrocoelium dendriticum]
MESQSSSCFNRCRNFSAPSTDPITVPLVGEPARQTDEHSAPSPVEPIRFRRASFSLSGERPTALDDLVDLASLHAASAAATREAATIKSLVSPTPELADSVDTMSMLDPAAYPRACAVPTAACLSTPSFPFAEHIQSGTTNVTWLGTPSSLPQKCSDESGRHHDEFVWYNTNSFPRNPLTSQLVLKYLASMATGAAEPESVISPPLRSAPVIGQNIPGMLPLSSSPLDSMTLPSQSLYRGHAALPISSHKLQLTSHGTLWPTRGRSPGFTEISSSAGVSDAETWSCSNMQGYMSDNPMLEATSEAKQLRLMGERLEADLYRSTASLPRSPKKKRSCLRSRGIAAGNLSASISGLDTAPLCDDMHTPMRADLSRFSASFHLLPTRTLCTPSSTTSTDRGSQPSVDPSTTANHSIPRFRSFLAHLKSHTSEEDNENYIYMGDEIRARRANALAVNVISPVSF